VHLLALINKFKYLFNAETWNILRYIRKSSISILRRVSGHTVISLYRGVSGDSAVGIIGEW